MTVLKHAFLTAGLYVSLAILLQIVLVLIARVGGSVGIRYSRIAWVLIFGVFWLFSFFVAWRVLRMPG